MRNTSLFAAVVLCMFIFATASRAEEKDDMVRIRLDFKGELLIADKSKKSGWRKILSAPGEVSVSADARLQVAVFTRPEDTSKAVQRILPIKQIRSLNLFSNQGADTKLIESLKPARHLEELIFGFIEIEDQAVDALATMKHLKKLGIGYCKFSSKEKVAWLKRKLKDCEVTGP